VDFLTLFEPTVVASQYLHCGNQRMCTQVQPTLILSATVEKGTVQQVTKCLQYAASQGGEQTKHKSKHTMWPLKFKNIYPRAHYLLNKIFERNMPQKCPLPSCSEGF